MPSRADADLRSIAPNVLPEECIDQKYSAKAAAERSSSLGAGRLRLQTTPLWPK